jgi:hypothetical protein
MGQLVTNSRFLMASPYSSRVRSTSPEGLSPLSEEKPWTVCGQDPNMNQDAQDAHVPRHQPLAGLYLSTPCSKSAPEWLSNPSVGQSLNSWTFMGRRSFPQLHTHLTCNGLWPFGVDKPSSGTSFEGVTRDGMCTIIGRA